MKVLVTSLLFFASATARAATLPNEFFCYTQDAEGGMLKVELSNARVCANGGPPRADWCTDQWAKSLPIARTVEGSVTINGQVQEFFEVTARSLFVLSEVQVIRIYKNVSATSTFGSDTYTDHHADLLGPLWQNFITDDPAGPLEAGNAVCRTLEPAP